MGRQLSRCLSRSTRSSRIKSDHNDLALASLTRMDTEVLSEITQKHWRSMALEGIDTKWYRLNFHCPTEREMQILAELDTLEDRRNRNCTYERLLEGMPILDSKFSEAMQARKWALAGVHNWIGIYPAERGYWRDGTCPDGVCFPCADRLLDEEDSPCNSISNSPELSLVPYSAPTTRIGDDDRREIVSDEGYHSDSVPETKIEEDDASEIETNEGHKSKFDDPIALMFGT